ncbi:MAG: hypothetical protein JWP09_34, partial [Candidatus Taylorbacteria bacterium]|nr:hypothetical protein [Candidatus Taylorbacteria bacterium]
ASIMGLLLALGSYIILSTVNKDLLNLNFNLGNLTVQQGKFETFTSNAVDKGVAPQYSQSSNSQVNGSLGAMGGAVNNQPNLPSQNTPDTSGSLGGDLGSSPTLPTNTSAQTSSSNNSGEFPPLPPTYEMPTRETGSNTDAPNALLPALPPPQQ